MCGRGGELVVGYGLSVVVRMTVIVQLLLGQKGDGAAIATMYYINTPAYLCANP